MKTARIAMLALLPLVAAAAFGQVNLSATLTGGTGLDPDGSGFAVTTFNGTQLTYTLLVQGIATPTAAHIHRASDGTVAVDLAASFVGGLATGTVTVGSQSLADAITGNPNDYVVNVHNAEYPNGAIQGTLAWAGTSESEPTELFVPVVAHVTGLANTNFKSDGQVFNSTTSDLQVTMDYFLSSAAGLSTPTATAIVTVHAGEQLAVSDIVSQVFQRTGNERGAVRASAPGAFAFQTRLYNDQRGVAGAPLPGTFSQYSRAFAATDTPRAGILLGLSNRPADSGQDYRTNVIYFNPNAGAVTLTLAAKKDDGTVLGTRTLTIPGYANDVVAVFDLINTVPADQRTQASFFITYTTGESHLFVQASVVDNITGDGLNIVPLPLL
jgi:hypothetical protein